MTPDAPSADAGQRCLAAYDTFETWSDLYDWLDAHRLTIEDAERTIRRACSVVPEGATRDEVVHYFRMAHNVAAEESAWVEFLAAFLHHRKRIRRARDRYLASPPEQRVFCLVAVPERDFGLVEPYVHRGSAAFLGAADL